MYEHPKRVHATHDKLMLHDLEWADRHSDFYGKSDPFTSSADVVEII